MSDNKYLATPKPAPSLNIPESASTVEVSIINTTSYLTLPMGVMTKPEIAGFKYVTCPSYSFLITHPPSGRKIIFDLGIRKDFENGPTGLVRRLKKGGIKVKVEKDVADILRENGVDLADVEAVIWSHYHFDHIGDPSTFPPNTALIVGPGVKGRFPTAWPSRKDAPVDEKAWEGRERREISFDDSTVKIGRFRAFDYFGDGSFYLLDSPGHLLGHLCGFARTTHDSFILMGGDAAHHAGEFRPTEYMPLPREISIDAPLPARFPVPCPGELVVEHIHPERSATKPFYQGADGFNEDSKVAEWSIDGIGEFDADDRVFSVIAHDVSLLPVVDFFPKPANEWRRNAWHTKGRWRFLADFSRGIKELRKSGKL